MAVQLARQRRVWMEVVVEEGKGGSADFGGQITLSQAGPSAIGLLGPVVYLGIRSTMMRLEQYIESICLPDDQVCRKSVAIGSSN